jgi:hypothetical protein
VNNPLRYLLFAVFFALTALPGVGRAASGDYVSLKVPNVAQAVVFFHDVINCDVIAQSAAANAAPAAMLDCGDGNTVELVGDSAPSKSSRSKPHAESSRQQVITFSTDNAVAATAWLRANHVAITGEPVRTAEGVDSATTVVDFVAPWGQPMRLVSHGRSDDLSAGTRLAAQ